MPKQPPIIGEQKPPDVPPTPGPTLNFSVTPDAGVFTWQMGNGFAMQQVVAAADMQQICKLWLESRKALMQEQQLVANIIRTKNN